MKNLVLLILLMILIISGIALALTTKKSPVETTVKIESIQLKAGYVDDNFKIDISLPDGYELNSGKKYPVVYMTDGNGREPEHETIHDMSKNGLIQEVIVVGIGYPDAHDVIETREREFLEYPHDFLYFIITDVIPYVDHNFRTDTADRTLYCMSLGSYFGLYALFESEAENREVFKNYILAAWCCKTDQQEEALFKAEKKLNDLNPDFTANLFLTVGEWEASSMIAAFNKVVETLESRNYSGLAFTHSIMEGRDHSTVGGPTMIQGLEKYLAAP